MPLLILFLAWLSAGCSRPMHPSADIRASVFAAPVAVNADDPAIGIDPSEPARSLLRGTNKVAAPAGALDVFGLDGKTRQTIRASI